MKVGEPVEYKTERSNRRTVALVVKENGLLVRAPFGMTDEEISAFVEKHRRWICGRLLKIEKLKKELEKIEPLSNDDIEALAKKALEVIPGRVRYYAEKIGVTYGKITIRNQRSKWGSCSPKGNLNFNCLLMLAPIEVLDSIIVHELCHRKEMNHSERFYAEVLRVFPTYPEQNKWLKENGRSLMMRMTGGK